MSKPAMPWLRLRVKTVKASLKSKVMLMVTLVRLASPASLKQRSRR
jgi:hypothetical protein